MKKLLLSTILGLALLSLSGCGEEKAQTKQAETPAMKCEAGKCGAAMEKTGTEAK